MKFGMMANVEYINEDDMEDLKLIREMKHCSPDASGEMEGEAFNAVD